MAASLLSKSERAYIQSSLQANPPLRADGRALLDFRTVLLETGVAQLANGSARLNIGKMSQEGGGGTEIMAAVKLEVEDVQTGDGVDGGRVVCSVTWCVVIHIRFTRVQTSMFERQLSICISASFFQCPGRRSARPRRPSPTDHSTSVPPPQKPHHHPRKEILAA